MDIYDHKIMSMFKIDDILIRKYLNISKLITDNIGNSYYYLSKNIPFFKLNDNLIAVYYLVNTKSNNIEIPIISMKNIRKKINIQREFMIKHSSKKKQWKSKNIKFIISIMEKFLFLDIINNEIIQYIYK
jgi:hypothetical protein